MPRKPNPPLSETVEVASFDHPVGYEPCMESHCAQQNAVRCNYTDMRKRQCTTTWCPSHWRTVGGVVYCRRHANTVVAIGGDPEAVDLPDIDNRGPSLVNWIYRDLDTPVRSVLAEMGSQTDRVQRDTAVTAVSDAERNRRWERSWKQLDHNGGVVRYVTVIVDDSDDALVQLWVNGGPAATGVPPWIDRHRRRVDVSKSVDQAQRQLFYDFLMEHLLSTIAPDPTALATAVVSPRA